MFPARQSESQLPKTVYVSICARPVFATPICIQNSQFQEKLHPSPLLDTKNKYLNVPAVPIFPILNVARWRHWHLVSACSNWAVRRGKRHVVFAVPLISKVIRQTVFVESLLDHLA